MAKKAIAAALLMVTVAWAEMSLAPMLAMHVWHSAHPVQIAMNAAGSQHHHNHVMPAEHDCCPKIHKSETAVAFELVAGSLPCQEEHRCCFAQGPQNPPAPPSASQNSTRQVAAVESVKVSPASIASYTSSPTPVVPAPPPALFSTILRV
jgi:hypothetical protein